MRAPKSPSTWIAVGIAAAGALWVVHYRLDRAFIPAHDLYAYFYPKVAYALACLRDGGRGLLWNPYQNCGQPFFAISQTGVLYPPYLLFLAFGFEYGLTAVLWLHLVIGGVGAYLLGRELGARPAAAIAAAVAFEMGNAMIGLTISSPTHAAPLAWMPVALLCCERAVRMPDLRRAAVLAVVLALTILPGMPQTVFFIYQLIALRVVWKVLTRSETPRLALLGTVGLGMGLGAAMAAVQLLPELEVASHSLRSTGLSIADVIPIGRWDFQLFRHQLFRRSIGQPFLLVPCMLAVAAMLAPRTRRVGAFYAAVGVVYFALSLGPDTPLFGWYSHLPGGSAFRDPRRFAWITSFCIAVTAGLGFEALLTCWSQRRYAVVAVALMALPLAALWLAASTAPATSPHQYEAMWHVTLAPWQLVFTSWERWAALLVLAAPLLACVVPRGAPWASASLLAALAMQVLAAPPIASAFLFPSPPPYYAAEPAFAPLRGRLSAQDRVYLVHDQPMANRFTFMAKTASLLRLPAILDYEPLVSRRYAEFSVMMRAGTRVPRLSAFLWRGPEPKPLFRRALLDLTAARFVIASPRFAAAVAGITPPLRRLYTDAGLEVWENPQSLPRAFWVPRVQVVADPTALLDRLAAGTDDPRAVALTEAPPPSGFLGDPDAAPGGTVQITRNDPEHLILDVDAPARGFVVLSDQFFPGWFASRDGQSVPIVRANYAFRLVEVPGGRSTIDLRYAPRSLWLGAAISCLSAVLVAVMWTVGARHAVPLR